MSPRSHPSLGLALALLLAAAGAQAQDFDRDGLSDAADNCPTVVNAGQEDRGGLASYTPNGSGDACECGDVNGDGAAHLNDATLIRRRFAGLGPALARPERCNVSGAPGARDADADGLRDDCTLVDLVVLRRALLGLAPGRGTACGDIVPADQVAPSVELIAPTRVTAGQPFAVRALASDDVGVGRLLLLVDGLAAREVGSGELAFDLTAPALPGAALALRVEAFDAAGNRGTANATVAVDAAPDVTPPIVALIAPPTAAPGSSVALAATATDSRGVALVRFLRGGELIATDASAPYEASLAIDAGATPDTLLALAAEAIDAEGNSARAEQSLRVVSAADTAPPTSVAVSAPARALAGQTLSASATALDDVGILEVQFFVDGAPVGSDAQAPYEASFAIPAATAPGTSLRWSARAVDFSSNAATSPEVQTLVAAPGRALIVGEVYDDTRSQPLGGARVRVAGTASEVTTDSRGRFALDLEEGPVRLLVTRDGFTDAQRGIDVPASGVLSPLDCRLTPRAAAALVSPDAGVALSSSDGRVALALPAGALPGATELRLTPLSEQSLPAPLPAGWAPLAAAEIAPLDLALALEGLVTFAGVAAPAEAIAARFDAATGVWRRVAATGSEVSLAALGAIALAVPDEAGLATPAVGDELGGVGSRAIPGGATAEILPSPRVLFLSPDARSDVEVALDAPSMLPSGTPLSVRFAESYDHTDGSRLVGESNTQDFLLYRRAAGMRAAFPATPSELFDAALLREGVIDLAAVAGEAATRTSVGAAGGALSTPDGVAVEIPAGTLASPTAVGLARVAALDPGLAADARVRFAAGVAFDLGGAEPAAAVLLRVTPATLPAPTDTVLVVRRVRVREATRFEWVGIAALEGAELVLRPGALGLPLPGADAAGEYLFVTLTTPVAFVAGVVTPPAGGALATALAETASLPFVSLADVSDPRYALITTLGASSVTGTDQQSGATASAGINPGVAGAVTALDLALASARPAVTSVSPDDLARQVDVDSAVTVAFTRPIAAQSLTPDTFRLLDGASPVAGALFVAADGLAATFRPSAPLRGLAPYTVALAAEVFDVFGNRLLGNQPDGSFLSAFETFDTAPPPRPAAGLVTLSIPRDGETEIRGSLGSAAEGTLLFAFNATTGVQTAAVAEPDGSFFALLPAGATDDVVLALQSLAGEITVLDPIPFTDPDGSAVIGARGGAFESAGGVRLSALPHALARSAEVRLVDLSGPELPADLPAGLTLLRGFRLDVPPALVQSVSELEVAELSGRVVGAQTFATPLRVQATRQTSPGTTTTTRFEFRAQATDTSGAERAVSLTATGNATPCSGSADVAEDGIAPRVRLRAPACLGPGQSFDLSAEAIQPRFDLSTPALAGDAPGTRYLLLRRVGAGAEVVYALEETATVQTVLGAPRLISDSRSPFGLRASGDYVIARADAPLAFVEGVASGDPALLATNRSTLGAATSGPNGAFLLPVPAGQAFALRTLSTGDGAERASADLAAVAAGEALAAGFVGPAALAALSVEGTPPNGGTVAANAALGFRFSQALDPATVVATALFVQDAEGRVVEGTRALSGGDTVVSFHPRRPWRAGEAYAFRVTRELLARSGARLVADATGAFSAFSPALLATIAGDDVRDAAVRGSVAYVIDGNRLRALDLTTPASPVEGSPLVLSPTPNRVALSADGASLLVSAGASGDFGTLSAFALASPLAPVPRASARLSTPSGAPAAPEASPLSGSPGPLAALTGAVVVSNRGVGLQRVDLAGLLAGTLAAPPLGFETAASLADAASDGTRLASVGPDALRLHDPATLALVGSAPIDGTAQDVDLATIGSRTLALVAAGLPGGVQVFDVTDAATPTRVAKILTGCAVQRLAADAPFERAWLACAGTRIFPLELAAVDGLDPIDRDADGSDDRLGGAISIPIPLVNFTLDAPHNVALVSGGAAGLAVVQLGPAEARIADVVRDPLEPDLGDAESILHSGRAFYGDRLIRVDVDVRIPPAESARALMLGNAPLQLGNGERQIDLLSGRTTLLLQPTARTGLVTTRADLHVVDSAGRDLARWDATLEPVPLDRIAAIDPARRELDLDAAGATSIAIAGIDGDGRYYELASFAQLEVSDPHVAEIAQPGQLAARGGGSAELTIRVAGHTSSLRVRSSLPPALSALAVEPPGLRLSGAGARSGLLVSGVFSDGSRRTLGAGDSLSFNAADPAVATVDVDGLVTAVSAGETVVTARAGSLDTPTSIAVVVAVPPDLSRMRLETEPDPVTTDSGVWVARAVLEGTGSLDQIPVRFSLAGIPVQGTPREAESVSSRRGVAAARFEGLARPGETVVTATVVDPQDGDTLVATANTTIVPRNTDVEPNDAPAAAVSLAEQGALAGTVGGSDGADFYRFDGREFAGRVEFRASPVDRARPPPELALTDATGAVVTRASMADGVSVVAADVRGVPLFVLLAAPTAATYELSWDFNLAEPAISSIDPGAGSVGDLVTIRGSGFSTRPDANLVLFERVQAAVESSSFDELRVRVPTFAPNGSVVVAVRSKQGSGVAFSTGVATHWAQEISFSLPTPENVVEEPSTGARFVRNRLKVSFLGHVARPEVEAIAASLGARIVGVWPPDALYVFEFDGFVSPAQLASPLGQLRARADVRYALHDVQLRATGFPISTLTDFDSRFLPSDRRIGDARVASAWHQILAPEAWQAVIDSGHLADLQHVRIAVVDSAVLDDASSRPQLQGVYQNFDALRPFPGTVSASSHGTHVAALIGARNVEDSTPRMVGVLGGLIPPGDPPFYSISVYDLRAPNFANPAEWELAFALEGCRGDLGADGTLIAASRDCSAGPINVDIVNMSFGTEFLVSSGEQQIKDIIRRYTATLFVAAAGNESFDTALHFPSNLSRDPDVGERVIAVGAVGQGTGIERRKRNGSLFPNESADAPADFTNWGDSLDLAAPGESVLSVQTRMAETASCGGETADYELFCGTSAATPLVTGAAALLKALDRSLTARDLKRILVATGAPIHTEDSKNNWLGWTNPRRLDLHAAVRFVHARLAGNAAFGADPPDGTPFSPGRKRFLWLPDALSQRMGRATLPIGIENTLNVASVPVQSKDLGSFCQAPAGAIASDSGDEVYLACRASSTIVAWNANVHAPPQFGVPDPALERIPLRFAGTQYALADGDPVQMALSPDGRTLAVPLRGRSVAFVDTQSERIREVRRYHVEFAGFGELRALAFDPSGRLLAVAGPATDPSLAAVGALLLTPPVGIDNTLYSETWPISANLVTTRRPLAPQQIPSDAPSNAGELGRPVGLAIERSADPNTAPHRVYVVYRGKGTLTAATVHRSDTLDPISAEASNRIRSNLTGRRAPIFGAGDWVASSLSDNLRETTASGASGMAVDSSAGRAFVQFRDTGNLGFLLREGTPNPTIRRFSSVSRIIGDFFLPRFPQRVEQTVETTQSGHVTTQVTAEGDLSASQLYEQAVFPLGLDLDQGGGLLVTRLAGRQDADPVRRLRLYSASRIVAANGRVAQQDGANPAARHDLDEFAADVGGPISADLDLEPYALRRVIDPAFEPQLSIVSPAPGSVVRGIVRVLVLVRDPGVDSLECEILEAATLKPPSPLHACEILGPPPVVDPTTTPSLGSTLSLSALDHGLGFPVRIEVGLGRVPNQFVIRPLAPGHDYVVRITGTKGSKRFVVERPFRQDG